LIIYNCVTSKTGTHNLQNTTGGLIIGGDTYRPREFLIEIDPNRDIIKVELAN